MSDREPAAVLSAFLAFLARRRVPCCVVGDDRRLAEVDSDIDLVVARRSLVRVPALMREFARAARVHLVQDIQHEAVARYFVYVWRGADGANRFLPIDVCSDWMRGGRRFLPARWLLFGGERATTANGVLAYQRPRPAAGFAYYLLKKIDKGWLGPEHGAFLAGEWRRDPAGCGVALRRFFTAGSTALIADAAGSGRWGAVAERLPLLRGELRRSPRIGPRSPFADAARGLRRLLRPTGMLLCLDPAGGDFAGAAERVASDWGRAFRAVTVLDDARPLGLFRYLREVRPKLVRSTLVITRSSVPTGVAESVFAARADDAALPRRVAAALRARAGAAGIGRYLPWAAGA